MNFLASFQNRTRVVLSRHWPNGASFVVGASLVGCIFCAEKWLRAGSFGQYGDYWEHAAVLNALIQRPWQPGNPQLLSPASSPRFGPITVLNALAARALGLDAPGGLELAAVAYTLLFAIGAWLFFREYFRDPRAGLYGLLVLLGSWWEAWTFTSIYQPKVLLSVACYPWFAAFGLMLLGLTLAVRVLRAPVLRAPPLIILVLWVSVVFLTHQLTAMAALSALCLLSLSEPKVTLSRRAWVASTALMGCILAAFWPYFSVWSLMAGGHQEAGWVGQGLAAAVSGGPAPARHRFYRLAELGPALGLAWLGVLALPYFFLKRRRLFVGLGVLSMLGPFVLNAFVPLPLGHRFLLLSVFFLQVAVVWLLLILTPNSPEFPALLDTPWRRRAALSLVWLTLVIFAGHNVLRTKKEWAYFQSYARRGESPYLRYSRRVAELVGPDAVVLGETLTLWPLSAFGTKVVALRHENPLVPDDEERQLAVERFFNPHTPDQERSAIIRRYRVTHVIVNREPHGPIARYLASAHRARLPAGYWLFSLPGTNSK